MALMYAMMITSDATNCSIIIINLNFLFLTLSFSHGVQTNKVSSGDVIFIALDSPSESSILSAQSVFNGSAW